MVKSTALFHMLTFAQIWYWFLLYVSLHVTTTALTFRFTFFCDYHRQFDFELLSFPLWIKVVQQCLFVDLSVISVPRKDEGFSSINKLLSIRKSNDSFPGPVRDDRLFFLGFVLVVVISYNNNDDILPYMNNNVRDKNIFIVVKEREPVTRKYK